METIQRTRFSIRSDYEYVDTMVTPGPELEFRKQSGGGYGSGSEYPRTCSSGTRCLEPVNTGIIVAQTLIIATHFEEKKFEERLFSPASQNDQTL